MCLRCSNGTSKHLQFEVLQQFLLQVNVIVVFNLLENFPLSDLLAETSTGLEASLSNSTSCRYAQVYRPNSRTVLQAVACTASE